MINFFTENIKFTLKNKIKTRNWLSSAALNENFNVDNINIIFCSDSYLLRLNKEYLRHNYFTDILTFDYNEQKNTLLGDIYISLDRVRDNSKAYNKTFYSELKRVMIHGVLHLIGYNDENPEDKKLMTSKEDFYLSLHPDYIINK